MKIQIDTTNKTISFENNVNLKEFLEVANNLIESEEMGDYKLVLWTNTIYPIIDPYPICPPEPFPLSGGPIFTETCVDEETDHLHF